jgi:16S rRNA (cytidine1402-2'-O)-methyltransferase
MAKQADQDRTSVPVPYAPHEIPNSLYVVATPLGNLRDVTLRALDVLKSVDVIAAEDTRTSAILLAAHGIRTRMIPAHDHNEDSAARRIVEMLAAGQSVALISDAGTPAVSDPGARIVRAVLDAGHVVSPVPGASAAISALSVAGCEGPFLFAGFLPAKSAARCTALKKLGAVPATLVLYEAPHRIVELARDLATEFAPGRRVVVARELTKRFETVKASTVAQLADWLLADPDRQRGEFVVVIEAPQETAPDEVENDRILALLLEEMPLRSAARLAAAITGTAKNILYQRALALKGEG